MLSNLKDVPSIEYVPGFHGKMIHTEHMTFAYWQIDDGASIGDHHHIHEQVINVHEGQIKMTIGGEEHILGHGDVYVIAPNVPHSGIALSPCKILDVFSPVREDYK